jgi:hypothetical protein
VRKRPREIGESIGNPASRTELEIKLSWIGTLLLLLLQERRLRRRKKGRMVPGMS